MASVHSVNVDAGDIMKTLTIKVHVRGLRVLQIRVWAAIQLLKLASFIAGCGIEILEFGSKHGRQP